MRPSPRPRELLRSRGFLADGSVLPLQDFLKPCLQTNFLKVRYRGDLINNSLTSESTH
jgi:hypothetical protein